MRKILIVFLLLAVGGAGLGYYLWNKPHEDIGGAKAAVTVSAEQLFTDFSTDEAAANTKYGADQTIAVTGKVKESSKAEDGTVKIMLETGQDFGIFCELDPLSQHARTDFTAGETITLKGKCAGLNLDVQMVRCVVGN
jgi:tRNA_anti-like